MTRFLAPRPRGVRGASVAELAVATACLVGVMAAAIPAFRAIGAGGGDGQAQTWTDGENRQALLRVGRELMNTSLETDVGGARTYIQITAGAAPVVLEDRSTSALDLGDAPGAAEAAGGDGGHGGHRKKSKRRGGRARSATTSGTPTVGDMDFRPRNREITQNSVLTFRKVSGYAINADGGFDLTFTTPIRYEVRPGTRELVRTQDGLERVVTARCSAFLAEITDAGTVVVTIVTQSRSPTTGRVATQSNQVEIRPKN